MVNSVAIRLATDGSAQVKADFAAIGDSGDASAKRIVSSFNKASDDAQAALDRLAKAETRVQGIMPASPLASINASTGVNADARAGGATYSALAVSMRQAEAAAEALRSQIDPLYAAQQRYDREMASASDLLLKGVISETEHATAVAASKRALSDAKNALVEHSGALGLNRQQVIIAQSAVLRFTDAVIAGRSPLTALALEAHKGVEVLSLSEGGLAAGFAQVAAYANPATVAIAAVTAVLLVGVASWVSYEDALARFDNLARGAGAAINATGQDLEASAEAAASHGALTVSAARDIETSYVQMGGIGKDVLGRLTALTADFAAATGTDAKGAQEALGRAMQDPIKGADELASRYGLLTQAQIEEITKIAEANGLFAAQAKLLDDLGPHVDDAAKHLGLLQSAWLSIKNAASGAFASMGAAIDRAVTGGEAIERLQGLQQTRSQLLAIDPKADTSAYDKRIKELQAQLNAKNDAPGSRLAEQANEAGSGYSGYSQLRDLKDAQAKIAAALKDPGAVAQFQKDGSLGEKREELEAYTHAIQTFLPPAEKKRQLDLADVEIAKARASRNAPALAAASAHREQIEQAGQIATAADVQADAAAKGERARARLDGASGRHAAQLGRETAAIEANTRAAMAAANAYVDGGAGAGEEAEARRKAVTDATKKGIGVDADVARQLAASVADAALAGAKSISTLREESAARREVNASVVAGKVSIDDMSQALTDENALRGLTNAQTLAQKKGLTDYYEQITRLIGIYKGALTEATAAQGEWNQPQASGKLDDRIADAKLSQRYAGNTTGAYDIAKVREAAQREAQRGHFNDPSGYADKSAEAAQEEMRAKIADTMRQRSNDNEVLRAQVSLIGISAEKQEELLDKLRAEQLLRGANVALTDDLARQLLAGVAAEDALKAHLQQVSDAWGELRQEGDRFIDDLFNPKGDGLKSMLKDIEQELIKLAAINPLKNLLLGESNPTLSSIASLRGGSGGGGLGGIGGLLGKLFGHGIAAPAQSVGLGLPDLSSVSVPSYDFTSSLFHFAAGTEYSPAGPAWVGENGPEIVNLPGGSKITNAADTRRMMGAANDPAHIRVSIETNDAMFMAKVSSVSSAHVEAATPGIRAGAVADVKEHYAHQARYSYGRS